MNQTKSIVDAAINREMQRQRGQEAAARTIQLLETLILQEQHAMRQLALDLAVMEGQGVQITGLQPLSGGTLLAAVHYVTADGQGHTLAVNHADPPTPPNPFGVVRPN